MTVRYNYLLHSKMHEKVIRNRNCRRLPRRLGLIGEVIWHQAELELNRNLNCVGNAASRSLQAGSPPRESCLLRRPAAEAFRAVLAAKATLLI